MVCGWVCFGEAHVLGEVYVFCEDNSEIHSAGLRVGRVFWERKEAVRIRGGRARVACLHEGKEGPNVWGPVGTQVGMGQDQGGREGGDRGGRPPKFCVWFCSHRV